MPRLRSAMLAAGFCAWLIGCAGPGQPGPSAGANGPPLAQPVSIDGNYNGVMQLVTGAAMSCGTQDVFSLKVQNRAFRYVPEPAASAMAAVSDIRCCHHPGRLVSRGIERRLYRRQSLAWTHAGSDRRRFCGFQFEADSVGSF